MKTVYIIILNYKNWEDVIECLESVNHSSYKNYKIIVIDNYSCNNSLENIREYFTKTSMQNCTVSEILKVSLGLNTSVFNHKVSFVQNDSNKGFGAGINPVLASLLYTDDYIWLLNPDTTIRTDTLEQLVSYASSRPHKSIIGNKIVSYYKPAGKYMLGGGRINFATGTIIKIQTSAQIGNIDFISGTSLFTHVSSFRDLGLLPENYFLYWEETDWCYQAKLKGYALNVCINAICYDKESASIGKAFLADFYYTRNGLAFVSKFRKQNVPLALTSALLRAGKRLLNGDFQRAKGVFCGMKAFLKSN